MKKSKLLLLILLWGSISALSSDVLEASPQVNAQVQKSENLSDAKSIVLGRFSTRQDADLQLNSLLDLVDSSSKVVNLELLHGFDYAVKDENGSYLVKVEPFFDDEVMNEVLQVVKERYPEAYTAECRGCIREAMTTSVAEKTEASEPEISENPAAQEQNHTVVEAKAQEGAGSQKSVAKEESAPSNLPFETDYLLYGMAGIAFIVLIYLLILKPKKVSKGELKEFFVEPEELWDEKAEESEKLAMPEESGIEEGVVTQVVEPAQPTAEREVLPSEAEEIKTVQESGEIKRRLREPNSTLTDISKDNFKEFAGLRLLVAEDNLINQKVIMGLLKDSGINIKIADDGQECLDILSEDPNYQIVLMDAHMPRVDGFEATRQIRANPAYDHITVIALSGDTGADDIRKMREAGMEEQLEKPIKVPALYQALYCYFDPSAVGGVEEETSVRLDNSLGLEMLGGDIELYKEILSEFQLLYRDSDEKIEQWISEGNIDEAKALLLDVKGIGESIGTAELTQTAEEFRGALINQQHDEYAKLLKRYRAQLRSILSDMAEV